MKINQFDIIVIDLNGAKGHEQKGYRPALVVSGNRFNKYVKGKVEVLAISNTDNGFPLHIKLEKECGTTGFVHLEDKRTLDLTARKWKKVGSVSSKFGKHIIQLLIELYQ